MQARLPSFWVKAGLLVALVAVADVLLFDVEGLGLNLGLFSLALVAALGLANPAVRRHQPLSPRARAAPLTPSPKPGT